MEAAVRAAEEATRLAPSDVDALEQLASVFADTEDVPRLNGVVERLAAGHPDHPARYYYAATLHFLRNEGSQAVAMAERGRDLSPTNARALNLLGAAYSSQGNLDAAREAFEAAVRVSPRDPTAYVNLGVYALSRANPRTASDYFKEALSLDPRSAQALGGLADALEQLGQTRRAAELRRLVAF
jgi:Flp pilus assembly protein TadD